MTELYRTASVQRLFSQHQESCSNLAHGFHRFQIPPAKHEDTLENWKRIVQRSSSIFARMGDLIGALHSRQNLRDQIFEANGKKVLRRDLDVDWRLVTGLGGIAPMNTGLRLHHLYGFPMLDGSGFKGAIRNAYKREVEEKLGIVRLPASGIRRHKEKTQRGRDNRTPWEMFSALLETAVADSEASKAEFRLLKELIARIEEEHATSSSRELGAMEFEEFYQRFVEPYQRLFGAVHRKGTVEFFDVLPVNLLIDGNSILEVDVVNPHHNKYYESLRLPERSLTSEQENDSSMDAGEESEVEAESSNASDESNGRRTPPADSNEPVPVFFLVLRRGTRLRFRAATNNEADRLFIERLLTSAATDYGFGGKVTDGYGLLI